MCCALFPHSSACFSYITVGHIMIHQSPVKSKIHTPNSPIHPWLVIYPEEVDKSHICDTFPLCNEVDIFICSVVLVYIQAVLTHSYNMILLGKVFTRLPNVLNKVCKRSIWFKNTTNLKFGAQS